MIFRHLRELRLFEKEFLAFLETIEDFDLVREIGFHQECGTPLTPKHICLLKIASTTTVQRRLRRLKCCGAVHQKNSSHDRRNVELALSPELLKIFAQYEKLVVRIGKDLSRS